ncbi:MAG: DUF2127 domain-containing protein [bacterium]|nr:DUF2127 domain-containing protein [bacterium]
MEVSTKRKVHLAFRVSLFLKGAFALVEIAGGVAAYFVSQEFLYDLASTVTQNELTEDPNDFVAQYLLQLAQDFSLTAQHFVALYLVFHGAIKFFLIMGLLKRRLSAYPASIAVFTLFIAYQLFRYSVTHSLWLIAISILDAFIVVLAWYEYRQLKRANAPKD